MRPLRPVRQCGFQLVELMIAMSLGLMLIGAFLAVLHHCQALFARHESVARLQDATRQALSVIVQDLEHAGFYGFTSNPAVSLVGPLPAGIDRCGRDFALDLASAVAAANNLYFTAADATDCAPTAVADGARDGADTLTVRHASLATSSALAGRLQIYGRRFESSSRVELFADGHAPGPVDSDHEIRDVEIRTYYIANSSVDRPEWPALRVKALTESRGAAQFRDEEVMPGVEDLQVELGIRRAGSTLLEFVAADSPDLTAAHLVAVRLWLRIRADSTESGFLDDRALDYADARFRPSARESRQRRVLVSRTVALRNSG